LPSFPSFLRRQESDGCEDIINKNNYVNLTR
jgi:hypothetical protein